MRHVPAPLHYNITEQSREARLGGKAGLQPGAGECAQMLSKNASYPRGRGTRVVTRGIGGGGGNLQDTIVKVPKHPNPKNTSPICADKYFNTSENI